MPSAALMPTGKRLLRALSRRTATDRCLPTSTLPPQAVYLRSALRVQARSHSCRRHCPGASLSAARSRAAGAQRDRGQRAGKDAAFQFTQRTLHAQSLHSQRSSSRTEASIRRGAARRAPVCKRDLFKKRHLTYRYRPVPFFACACVRLCAVFRAVFCAVVY